MDGATVTALRSSSRRSTLSYLAVLRGASAYHVRAQQFHAALALVALALVLPSDHVAVAVPLVLVALAGPALNFLLDRHTSGTLRELGLLRRIAESVEDKEGRHQLNLPALLEILGLICLTVTFSWVVTDLPGEVRLIGVVVAVAHTISVAHAIYSDHTWYNPVETHPPRWHEGLRSVAGVSTSALVAGLALPGAWTPPQRTAVAILAALPLVVGVRIRDLDQTVAVLDDIVQSERARGRQLVLDETERALSRPLAELEELAQQHRGDAPLLADLALHARRRLVETLATTEQPGEHPPTIDDLLGPVLTLARAIGVSVRVHVPRDALGHTGLDTAAWVMRDLVGNAINAAASRVEVVVWRADDVIHISVSDDGSPIPPGVWKAPGTSSAGLERHLILLDGSLEAQQDGAQKVVTARYIDTSGQAVDERQGGR